MERKELVKLYPEIAMISTSPDTGDTFVCTNGHTITPLDPLLSWSPSPGATQFHIQITPATSPLTGQPDGPGIDLIIGDSAMVEASRFKIPQLIFGQGPYVMLPDLSYTWRIRFSSATTSIGVNHPSWGNWMPGGTFKTRPATSMTIMPLSPSVEEIAGLRPTVVWDDADPEAFYYEVQLSTDSMFRMGTEAVAPVYWNRVHGGESTRARSWTVPAGFDLQRGTRYYWRVRPRIQGDGMPVGWLPAASFMTTSSMKPRLTVAIGTSNAAGRVSSAPGGINCPLGSCWSEYDQGQSVTLTAVAEQGWRFDHWRADCSGTATIATVVMDTNKVCDAMFTPVR